MKWEKVDDIVLSELPPHLVRHTGYINESIKWLLFKTENQWAKVQDLLYLLTLARQTIDWIKRATNFPYFLHIEFGGFTARKLLD